MLEKEEEEEIFLLSPQPWHRTGGNKYLLDLELFPATGGLSAFMSLATCTNVVAYKDSTKECVCEMD